MLVRMYAAKERETLVIETAHILSFGLFLCPQAFEKVSVDIGCKRKLTQNITHYEKYCDAHPEFENQIAVAAIAQIKETYGERLKKHDFLA